MDYPFSIRFGKQPSGDYQAVLALATKFRMFLPATEGMSTHVIETSNHEVMTKFEVFEKLMDIIRDWDSARVLIEGIEQVPSDFMLEEK